ncbi:MAG: DNA mismatch repair endonuclease MutL [Planctomycetes bacterium]|nr:DNA mismatch repair endonuclease MutL [Planctomycetota bacterium]
MSIIQKLPSDIVNRIAAGEVIERPASVIKELVENSIDAGATEILIDLEDGGCKRLTVRDNGCGMDPSDLQMAFESHSTSKLDTEGFREGMFGVDTLGFRGEALPSIGSVAEVEAVSRTPKGEHAYRYRLDGQPPEPAAGEPGTVLEVRNLFSRLPARRKFLRRPATELSHIIQQVTRIALAYPGVSFLVTNMGKRSLDLAACDTLRERLGQILGADKLENLIEVAQRGDENSPHLHGFISAPALRRGDTRMQNFFVNGRWVRARLFTAALRAAYKGYLIPGKHPLAYLFFEFPAEAVDVNVHPTKSEVRFRNPGLMYPLVYNVVSRALEPEDRSPEGADDSGSAAKAGIEQAALDFFANPPPSARGASASGSGGSIAGAGWSAAGGTREAVEERRELPAVESPGRVFQLLNSFILVEEEDGILLIDQHALHEKILFEGIYRQLLEGEVVQQQLMVPEILALSVEQVPLLEDGCRLLGACGYEAEPFGEAEVAIRAVPELFEGKRRKSRVAEICQEVFSWLEREGDRYLSDDETPELLEQRLRALASLMACKRAVKAGDRLSPEEIDSLLEHGDLAMDPRNCPHGRPTMVRLSRRELDSSFDRK